MKAIRLIIVAAVLALASKAQAQTISIPNAPSGACNSQACLSVTNTASGANAGHGVVGAGYLNGILGMGSGSSSNGVAGVGPTGVTGQTSTSSGTGVFGYATGSGAVAVKGTSTSGKGGVFTSSNDDGLVSTINVSNRSAISASNASTTGGNAIYAACSGSCYAGYFQGNVNITGHLYVNGVEVTELLTAQPRERYASVFGGWGALIAIGGAGFVAGYRRRRVTAPS